jgi:hypothetical protein
MHRALARRQVGNLSRAAALGAVLSALFVATAVASGNVVLAHAPGNVTVGTRYAIKLSGHADTTERLYMFVDYQSCASTPAGEHVRANGDIWKVKGDFRETSANWSSPHKGKDHVCAYLVKASAPKNPSGGVLAHDFVTYYVH